MLYAYDCGLFGLQLSDFLKLLQLFNNDYEDVWNQCKLNKAEIANYKFVIWH